MGVAYRKHAQQIAVTSRMIIISPIPAPTVAPTKTSILPPSSSSKHIHTHEMVTSHVRLKIGVFGELYS